MFAVDGTKVRLNKKLEEKGYKVENGIVHDFSIEKNMSERKSALEYIKTLKRFTR